MDKQEVFGMTPSPESLKQLIERLIAETETETIANVNGYWNEMVKGFRTEVAQERAEQLCRRLYDLNEIRSHLEQAGREIEKESMKDADSHDEGITGYLDGLRKALTLLGFSESPDVEAEKKVKP